MIAVLTSNEQNISMVIPQTNLHIWEIVSVIILVSFTAYAMSLLIKKAPVKVSVKNNPWYKWGLVLFSALSGCLWGHIAALWLIPQASFSMGMLLGFIGGTTYELWSKLIINIVKKKIKKITGKEQR